MNTDMLNDDLNTISQEHNTVVLIERLTHHIARIRDAQEHMKNDVSQIADALTRLALVEERQTYSSGAIDRLARSIESLDIRVKALEVQAPSNTRTAAWVDKVLWVAAGATFAMLIAKSLGVPL